MTREEAKMELMSIYGSLSSNKQIAIDTLLEQEPCIVINGCDMRANNVGVMPPVTPIPDNATNGDMIKAIFPNTEIMITDERVFLRDGTIVMIYPLTWWNTPYQKGGKE